MVRTDILVKYGVMPKSWNLPMTTKEPISDAKAREFLLPSLSCSSHRYRCSGYREEPRVLDYIAYIGSIHGKKGFLGRGMSDWSLSFEGLCVGSWLVPIVKVDHKFLSFKSGDFGLGSDWLVGSGVRSGDFQRLFSWNLTKWSFSFNKME